MANENSEERYVHDYDSVHTKQIIGGRTASVHAAFFLPYLKPGMKLLDVGCGPGTITLGLAEAIAPGEAFGIDMAESQVEIARSNAQQLGLTNTTFDVANVYDLPFENDIYDAAFIHAAIEHISEPMRGLKEISRVLKPGGVIGLRSGDWRGLLYAPRTPELEEIWELQSKIRHHNGGHPFIGTSFRALLREAGFVNTKATATYETWGTDDETKSMAGALTSLFTDEASTHAALSNGWIDESGLQNIVDTLNKWSEHPDALFAHPWCEAVGFKV